MLDKSNNWGVYFFMVKFSREEKVMAVRSYLDGNDGVKRRAQSMEVYPIVIQQRCSSNNAFHKIHTD